MPSAAPKKLFLISLAAVVAVVRGDEDFDGDFEVMGTSNAMGTSNSAAICFAPSPTCVCLGGDAAGLCILTWVAILVIVAVIAIPICCFCGLCAACGYTAGGCCKQDRYGAPYALPDPEFGGQAGVYGRA